MADRVGGDGGKKNVDFILLAEFDIEKGSTVSYQYPSPPGTELQ